MELIFNDARIKRKLDNYAFISCDLHVKAVVNSSPFFYGALQMSYEPLPAFSPNIDSNFDEKIIPLSQRPHIFIYPQSNSGGEMTLPFFYYKNWLELGSASELTAMGSLAFNDFNPLRSANGVANGSVGVTIYAWADNIRITGPTVNLAVQSGDERKDDEYGKGIVSAPASALAYAASWFEDIPLIGKFATATRIGANALSGISTLFGYTNVPVVSDTLPYKSQVFHSIPSACIGDPVDKLTLDPKNELSIDPRTTGMPPTDELDCRYLFSRESFLTNAIWQESDAANANLFWARVTPALYDTAASTNQTVIFNYTLGAFLPII